MSFRVIKKEEWEIGSTFMSLQNIEVGDTFYYSQEIYLVTHKETYDDIVSVTVEDIYDDYREINISRPNVTEIARVCVVPEIDTSDSYTSNKYASIAYSDIYRSKKRYFSIPENATDEQIELYALQNFTKVANIFGIDISGIKYTGFILPPRNLKSVSSIDTDW